MYHCTNAKQQVLPRMITLGIVLHPYGLTWRKHIRRRCFDHTHAIEAIGFDDIVIVVEVTNAMPSATGRNDAVCN